jgi:hypothetical protein
MNSYRSLNDEKDTVRPQLPVRGNECRANGIADMEVVPVTTNREISQNIEEIAGNELERDEHRHCCRHLQPVPPHCGQRQIDLSLMQSHQ